MIKNFKYSLSITVLLLFLISCKNELKIPKEILNVSAPISIERFDKAFYNVTPTSLDSLQGEYPFLFPMQYSQEFWLEKSRDTLQQELVSEVSKVFPNNEMLEKELQLFFKHLKFYYNEIEIPKIITLISEVDYKSRVILRKNLLLLALDCYLGENHHFYDDISLYLAQDFEKELLVVDVAMAYTNKIITKPDRRTFLSNLIMYGKRLYIARQLLPKKTVAQVFSYTPDEWQWNVDNESLIWRYFVDQELLYSSDRNLLPRFLYPAPFSKFYRAFDSQSPDRVGQFVGYQIVNAFMQNNNVSLQELKHISSETIFSQSRYKPKK